MGRIMLSESDLSSIIVGSVRYVLSESLNNFDAPLYHNTTISGLLKMMETDSIESNYHRGYSSNGTHNGICLTRSMSYNPYAKYTVRLKFDMGKLLSQTRRLKLIPYQDDMYAHLDEYEERLVSTDGKPFTLTNLPSFITEVRVVLGRIPEAIADRRNNYEEDVKIFVDGLRRLEANNIFGDRLKVVKHLFSKESMNISDAIEYLSEECDNEYHTDEYYTYFIRYYDNDTGDLVSDGPIYSRAQAIEAAKNKYDEDGMPVKVLYGSYDGERFTTEIVIAEIGQ